MRRKLAHLAGLLAAGIVFIAALIAAIIAPADPRDRQIRLGHESSDVRSGGVIAVACVLLAGLAIIVVVTGWMQARLVGRAVSLRPPPAGVANAADGAVPAAAPAAPPL